MKFKPACAFALVIISFAVQGATGLSITGSPVGKIEVDAKYAFLPAVANAGTAARRFDIHNKPRRATFDTATGRLSGVPKVGDAGIWSGISISVSQGTSRATLPTFAIVVEKPLVGAVPFYWELPTENTDGSALTDLAGYILYMGPSESQMTVAASIDNPTVSSYLLEYVDPGEYVFALQSVTLDGRKSPLSNFVRATVR